ncbi:MAG: Ribosome-recycling factor [Alphaproteobacteria bacterium MarineAlpha11_Bin1]|nr:MAG: Ribosome-recycling factor [Alphaproteobacteria bacterium MarineAlpha11_Bin1]|tara:strand:- start:9233 stop:9790 length:558 start_codon:yes stop_codon:yes gene_type:complete
MADPDINDLKRRMRGAVEVLKEEFGGLRTGRASPALLEPIHVDAYGSNMPLNQIGTISAPDARTLSVQVWDNSLVPSVEKAIRDSDLGLNPQTEGNVVRVPVPQLSEERRVEMTKVASKYAEQARVAVRNVRRDGIDNLKKMEKEGEISQDEQHAWVDEVQTLTDDIIKDIDKAVESKEMEILQV